MHIRRRTNLALLTLAVLLGGAAMNAARAHHLLPPHTLNCSANFPCPTAIQPRVHFWIEVFRSWDKKTAILHDPNRPERVYAVFNSGRGCNRAARTAIKRKRNQVKKALQSVASKIESGRALSGGNEKHLAALFPAKNPREIRAAAANIRCQSGVRDSFLRGLKGYARYRPMVGKILKENNLPAEIRYLPFVESSYNPAAYSKAGAAGMWQIMPRTARVLGLELSATLDERLDPEAATRAAAEYLKRAARVLTAAARKSNPAITRAQLNPFIITSYNYGVNGMERAIRQVEPDFMTVLERYKSPRFQIAVKNFYASFLAARHVALNAERYFGFRAKADGGGYQTVVLQHPTSIARITDVFGLSEAALRPLNRALTRFVWRGWRLIPAGYRLRLPARSDQWRAQRDQLASLSPETVISGGDRYTVRRGDTACGIARAVKVNCSELIRLNRLGKKAVIHIGQKLLIPGKLVLAGATVTRAQTASGSQAYRVRKGDTACGIAKRFGVGCRTLISHNQLGRSARIYAGQTLSIPGGVQPYSLNADNLYIVRKGDSACRIARRFSVHCDALRDLNQLNRRALIHPGQKLKIPGLVLPDTSRTARELAQVGEVESKPESEPKPEPETPDAQTASASDTAAVAETGTTLATPTTPEPEPEPATPTASNNAGALRNLLDTLPDLSITVTDVSGQPVYTVRVQAEETLGHFADWLGIAGTGNLRRLNRLRSSRIINIGKHLILPIADAQMAERFEQQRTDYHQVLSESLKEHYDLVGTESYTVRKGDSPWSLSDQLEFPVWLLYRLNPILHSSAQLKPGQALVLPKLKAKT